MVKSSEAARKLIQESGVQIVTNNRFMREITADALQRIGELNADHPFIFVHGGALSRIIENEGVVKFDALDKDALRGILDRSADFVQAKFDKEGQVTFAPSRPPMDVVRDILSLPKYDFPVLKGIAQTPVLLPDGRFLLDPGYDEGSGFFLHLNGLEMPRRCMPVSKALALIRGELLVNFPFVDEASFANSLTYFLLPIVRLVIIGPTPLCLIDSPTPGTGKGLLANLIAIVALGRQASVMRPPRDDDEANKTITALLLEGSPVIALDNVSSLSSSALCAVLTTTRWRGRLLSQSRIVDVPNMSLWLATGNNVTLTDEMARRSVLTRLDDRSEHPEDRDGFKHPLPAWALEHRGKLVSACLSLIGAWVKAGSPRGTDTMGGFEDWAATMGGILKTVGVKGFLQNRDVIRTKGDRQTADWIAFCRKWYEIYREPVTAGELFRNVAKPNLLLSEVWSGRGELGAAQRIGHALQKQRDRIFGDYIITAAGEDSSTGSASYLVELAKHTKQNP